MLHVTNGDIVADGLREAGVPGTMVPWRDVLHEGPVPAGLDPDGLRRTRARFVADLRWEPYEVALAAFAERDAALTRAAEQDEVVLWFEHDLYDQLQLIQVLDAVARLDPGGTRVSLIGVGAFPGVEPFYGLGQLRPDQLASLFPSRRAVTPAQLDLARAAWAAFRAPEPAALTQLLAGDTSALPFLGGALVRLLEQYPAAGDGLSRTERQIVEAVAGGARTPAEVFRANQAREAAPFMGDSVLWVHLHALGGGPAPMLEGEDGAPLPHPTDDGFVRSPVALTEAGRAVLAGRADRVALGGVDRWIGGGHLVGQAVSWRWDAGRGTVVGLAA